MIKKYKQKGTGRFIRAIKLTEELASDANTLMKLPVGFKALSQSPPLKKFTFKFMGQIGTIDQWFVYPAIIGEKMFFNKKELNRKYELVKEKKGMGFQPIQLPKKPSNNALEFELAIKGVIAKEMAKGLTVTEAVGTLQLCSMDMANQFFKNTNQYQHGVN